MFLVGGAAAMCLVVAAAVLCVSAGLAGLRPERILDRTEQDVFLDRGTYLVAAFIDPSQCSPPSGTPSSVSSRNVVGVDGFEMVLDDQLEMSAVCGLPSGDFVSVATVTVRTAGRYSVRSSHDYAISEPFATAFAPLRPPLLAFVLSGAVALTMLIASVVTAPKRP